MQNYALRRRGRQALPLHGVGRRDGDRAGASGSVERGDSVASTQDGGERSEHGLGLKLATQIVKAHQGRICFAARDPHGLEVTIFPPLGAQDA